MHKKFWLRWDKKPLMSIEKGKHKNWIQNHSSLQFKKVHNTRPIYSVRINVDYRALGEIDGNDIIWIGPHREYEKVLRRI
ncbi:hypothetical protein C6501_00590 [Candidatus Poribacteria bacterium]|nr:MAG: hypothetical protein C6501_00590 [Candidatus Poribacteria bacterium]